MKRNVFFWLEKLKINRGERNAITALMAILLMLTIVNEIIPKTTSFDSEYYTPLEETFKKRSQLIKQKDQKLLARYRPAKQELVVAIPDTVTEDSLIEEKPGVEQIPSSQKVNVNTADAKELQSLPGIGPAYAGRIIDYRQKNGGFTSYEELLKIKGIGKKRLEKLLPFIQLKEPIENK